MEHNQESFQHKVNIEAISVLRAFCFGTISLSCSIGSNEGGTIETKELKDFYINLSGLLVSSMKTNIPVIYKTNCTTVLATLGLFDQVPAKSLKWMHGQEHIW